MVEILRQFIEFDLTCPLVVPSEDSHQSEYIAACDARRGG